MSFFWCNFRHFSFRISELRTTRRIVAPTVTCFSPPMMLSPPTFPVSSCSTRLSTRSPLMELLSSKFLRRRESFPESRSTVVLLIWWHPKVRIRFAMIDQKREILTQCLSIFRWMHNSRSVERRKKMFGQKLWAWKAFNGFVTFDFEAWYEHA